MGALSGIMSDNDVGKHATRATHSDTVCVVGASTAPTFWGYSCFSASLRSVIDRISFHISDVSFLASKAIYYIEGTLPNQEILGLPSVRV